MDVGVCDHVGGVLRGTSGAADVDVPTHLQRGPPQQPADQTRQSDAQRQRTGRPLFGIIADHFRVGAASQRVLVRQHQRVVPLRLSDQSQLGMTHFSLGSLVRVELLIAIGFGFGCSVVTAVHSECATHRPGHRRCVLRPAKSSTVCATASATPVSSSTARNPEQVTTVEHQSLTSRLFAATA